MSRFNDIDLSSLAAPDVVQTVSFDAIKAELIADATARLALIGVDYNVGMLETDPVVKILEAAAYREILLRQRINDAARAVMLASAVGSDLDHLAALYKTARMDGESDVRFLERVQLAPEALSMGGAAGAYIYHALSVSIDVLDAAVHKPAPGHVQVFVLAVGGPPSSGLLSKIAARFRDENLVPFTDSVSVCAATPVAAAIDARLSIGRGPDPALLRALARERLNDYLLRRRRIGKVVAESGIKAALSVPGVDSVSLVVPLKDMAPAVGQYVDVTEIAVTTEVIE